MKHRTEKPRRPRLARAAIWALFAAVSIAGFNLSGMGKPSTLSQERNLEYASQPVSTTEITAVPQQATGAQSAADLLSVATSRPGTPTLLREGANAANADYTPLINAAVEQRGDPLDLLPAWRWRDDVDLSGSYSATEIAPSALNGIANFFMLIASWVWWLILGALNLAMSLNLLRVGTAAEALNNAAAGIGNVLFASGLVIIVLAMAMFLAVRASIKGALNGAVSIMLAALIPLGFLFAVTSAASGAPKVDAPGTPVWIGLRGLTIVDSAAAAAGNQLAGLCEGGKCDGLGEGSYSNLTASCRPYKTALVNAFSQWRIQEETGSKSLSATSAASSLSVVSGLWERAFLDYYVNAQYNGAQAGTRIYCHQLEAQGGVSRAEQTQIGMLAGYPEVPANMGLNSQGLPIKGSDRKDPYSAVDNSGNKRDARLLPWAACINQGGTWYAQESWAVIGQMDGGTCSEWWKGDKPPTSDGSGAALEFNVTKTPRAPSVRDSGLASEAKGSNILEFSALTDSSGKAISDDTDTVTRTVIGMHGDNGGGRLISGLLAMFTAGVYLYVLGGIALGTLMAKVGLLLMLMLLPVTLFLLAMPTGGKGRHPGGIRMLKMTGGYLAANFVMTAMLMLLLSTIMVLTQFSAGFLGGGNGIVTLLVPLIALMVLRKALKAVGLGDIATAKGGMGLASLAAAGAISQGGVGKDGKSNRLRAMQEKNKKWDEQGWGGGKLGKWAHAKAGKWDHAASERWGSAKRNLGRRLGGRFAQLTGHSRQDWKDRLANGNLLSRMTTAAGLAEIMGRRLDGKHPRAAESIRAWGNKFSSFNPERLEAAQSRQLAADAQRENWQATKGLQGPAREAALAVVAEERTERYQSVAQHVVNPVTGTAVFTSSGEKVYGFTRVDASGVTVPVPASEAFDLTSGAMLAGVAAVTTVAGRVSDVEATAAKNVYARTRGLDITQALPSAHGLPPMAAPQLSGASGRAAVPEAQSLTQTADLARDPMHYAPDSVKAKLASYPPEVAHHAWTQMLIQDGMLDPTTGSMSDFAMQNGIDLSSSAGMDELEKNLRGEPSMLDSLSYEPSAAALSLALAEASRYQAERLDDPTTREGAVTFCDDVIRQQEREMREAADEIARYRDALEGSHQAQRDLAALAPDADPAQRHAFVAKIDAYNLVLADPHLLDAVENAQAAQATIAYMEQIKEQAKTGNFTVDPAEAVDSAPLLAQQERVNAQINQLLRENVIKDAQPAAEMHNVLTDLLRSMKLNRSPANPDNRWGHHRSVPDAKSPVPGGPRKSRSAEHVNGTA